MLGTAGEVRMKSKTTFSYGFQYVDTPVLANQRNLYTLTLSGHYTYQELWMIGTDCEREPIDSLLSACLDDDDDDGDDDDEILVTTHCDYIMVIHPRTSQ